jgi:hypothetical protein
MDDIRPIATPEREKYARSLFRLDLSVEEYAARYAHKFALFNFQKCRYETPGMTAWVDQLAAFFSAPDLPRRLRAVRERFLSAEEIEEVEAYERDPF